jgi:Sulfotransferase domain
MLVICNGMPRSASTWSFNVAVALLRGSRRSDEVYSGYDEDIARFLESIPATAAHAVLKCHQLDTRGRATARSDAKTIYTWRDPADAIVSCMRMFDYDFDNSLAVIDSSLQLYHFHREAGAALILEYGQIVTASTQAVQRIATFLGLEARPDAIRAVTEQTSLDSVKKQVQSPADDALVQHSGLEYNPETLLHRKHVRDGTVGYGRKALTSQQTERVDALLRKHSLPPS